MKIDHLPPDAWTAVDPSRIQKIGRRIFTRPARFIVRYRGFGHEPRVPQSGGFLLTANHGSRIDPFVLGMGQERVRLRFMAKEEALRWPIAGRLIRWLGGFPVKKGGGRAEVALAIAREVINSGDGVVMFIEGRVHRKDDGLLEPRSGIARLALMTGAPVVPVGIWGGKRATAYGKKTRPWRLRRITAVWGEPRVFEITPTPSRERVAEVRDQIWSDIVDLYTHARELGSQQ